MMRLLRGHRVAVVGTGISTAVVGTIITALLLLAPEPPGAEYQLFIPAVTRQPTSLKRGLATHHPEVAADVGLLGVTWRYNWLADIPTAPGVESVPMVYSAKVLVQLLTGARRIGGDSSYLMGFNEPDRSAQANLTPAEAVAPWLLLERIYPDRLLVSPAPSHLHPEWLAEFRTVFTKAVGRPPRFDVLAVHCYFANDASGCRAVIEQAAGYARDWNIEGGVWVTEFGPVCSAEGFDTTMAESEASEFVQWLEAHPQVTRYAWFPARLDGSEYWHPNLRDWAVLVDGEGLTRWGQVYVGAIGD